MTIARLALVGFLAGATALAATSAEAAKAKRTGNAVSAYDGLWSVLIITEKGTCDRGYRYAVRIKSGKVGHADPANSSFLISGTVAGGGAARVSVTRANQSASGSGRLTRDAGTGRWQSAKGECSGVWQAERRGS